MKPARLRSVAIELELFAPALLAAQAQSAQTDLTTLKIEDLMKIDVTPAAKKEQKISKVPAAILVITQEDISRSVATNIPDLLRMVPGLEVAQINPSTWAISVRGFRLSSDHTMATLRVSSNPPDLATYIFSSFVQDEIAIRPNRLYASLGPDLTKNPSLIRRSAYAKITRRF